MSSGIAAGGASSGTSIVNTSGTGSGASGGAVATRSFVDASATVSSGALASGTSRSPPSCAPGGPGMTNCGPGGSGTESCCTSLEVTGGTYYRTYDGVAGFDSIGEVPAPVPQVATDGGPTAEADPATVSSFRLDKYLVTVGRFRQFVNAALPGDGGAGWLPALGSGKHTHLNGGLGLVNVGADGGVAYEQGWIASYDSSIAFPGVAFTWTTSAGSQENLPISGVTWVDAYAFCIWDGGFLPSEAEWGYAAAGGAQQREYPWGSTDPGTNNQYAIFGYGAPVNGNATGCYYPDVTTCTAGSAVNIAPVGTATLGAGLWGHLDLAGEMFEWVLDSYDTYVNPCVDCANTTGKGPGNGVYDPAFRGGSYATSTYYLLAPLRYDGPPPIGYPWGINGFRCARTP
jgi:sulfatase modifying factor 1